MFERVIIPVTLRESTGRVESLLSRLSRLTTRSVLFFHVRSDRSRRKTLSLMERFKEMAKRQDLSASVETRSGPVAETTVNGALEHNVGAIAVPFARKGWLQRALLGSVTKDIIRYSPIPVFVHKNWPNRDRDDSVFRVLYASSLTPSDDSILSIMRASNLDLESVILLHVGRRAPDPRAEADRYNQVITGLNSLVLRWGLPSEAVEIESVIGRAKRQIVRRSRLLQADLIVLGKSDSTKGLEHVLGSTAEEVSYNAWSSVLVVPTQTEPS